jgi:hypothetical protein
MDIGASSAGCPLCSNIPHAGWPSSPRALFAITPVIVRSLLRSRTGSPRASTRAYTCAAPLELRGAAVRERRTLPLGNVVHNNVAGAFGTTRRETRRAAMGTVKTRARASSTS